MRPSVRTAVALGLVTVALYLPGVGWGVPVANAPDRIKTFATDEIVPLEALAEMRNTFVESRPDRNYGYPWWHYFVVASAQAPYLAYLKATGGMSRPGAAYPYGLANPVASIRALTIIGRLVTVVMTGGIVVAAYCFGLLLFGPAVGLVGALLVMTNYLLVYYGRTANLDAPALFWTAIGLVVFADILRRGLSPRRAALLGVFAGIAMATKDQSILVFGPIALALLFPRMAPDPAGTRGRSVAMGLVASLAAYFVTTGMVVDPARHIRHVTALLFAPSQLAPGSVYFPPAPHTSEGRLSLVTGFLSATGWMLSWPVLGLVVLGAIWLRRANPRVLVLLLSFVALFIALVIPTGFVVRRYLLPMTFIADCIAGYAIIEAGRRFGRGALVAALVLGFGWRTLNGVELVAGELTDTRGAAARWLAEHARPGDRLEHFGVSDVLPPLPPTVSVRRIMGRDQWIGQRDHGPAVVAYLAAGGPEWIVSIPDWSSKPGMDRSADCPAEVCDGLVNGSLGYRQAAYFPACALFGGILHRPPLDNPSVCPPVRIFARSAPSTRGTRGSPGPARVGDELAHHGSVGPGR